jgi:hypothetical protein
MMINPLTCDSMINPPTRLHDDKAPTRLKDDKSTNTTRWYINQHNSTMINP